MYSYQVKEVQKLTIHTFMDNELWLRVWAPHFSSVMISLRLIDGVD